MPDRVRRGAARRRTFLACAAAVACLLASVACGSPGERSAARSLVVADSYPTTHPASRDGARFFIERVTELTGGELEFRYYPSAQIGNANDYMSLVRSEAVDIGMVSPPYLAEKLPLSNVGDLPGWQADSCEMARAVGELMAEGQILDREEYAPRGLRVLFTGVVPQYEIFSADGRAVTRPEDLRGLLVRSSGGVLDQTLEGLGATPVSISGPEIYEAMSRGTVDAMGLPHLSAPPYRLDEVASNATAGAPLGNFTLTFATSRALWNELTPEQRAAFEQAGRETTAHLCRAMQTETEAARAELAAGGIRFESISDDRAALWQRAVEPVRRQWVADMEARGRPGADVVAALTRALDDETEGQR